MGIEVKQLDGVAVVTIANPPVNAASQSVRQALMDAVIQCDSNSAIVAVVVTGAGRLFMAGGDIKEFGLPPVEPHLPDVLLAIEKATTPWVAAVHGAALGGGLELALACRARIADKEASLGFPEVHLGLIPGAGGTVRLPRLVAAETCLDMIVGGKPISAARAYEIGLVDEIVEGDLLTGALSYAKSLPSDLIATLQKAPNFPTDNNAFESKKSHLSAKARGQLSIDAAINAVDNGLSLAPEDALQQERDTFIALKNSDQSTALRYIFLAERASLSDPRCKAESKPIDHVGVIGGGTMGAGIAASCLLAGIAVTMIETDDKAANTGALRVKAILANSSKRGLISEETRQTFENSFDANASYQTLAKTQLVIEAVFEDMSVKKQVFESLSSATPNDAILASNTSYLDINELAQVVTNPSRVIGMHFFSPAHIMKLLEIVLPDSVSDQTVASATAFAKRLKKTAVLAGVCDGFIGNRIMSAYRREADYLLEDGAYPQQVDRSMKEFGFPMGIFEMQDMAGLDISWAMRKRQAATRDPNTRYVNIADKLCEQGRFGRKTDKGWYRYSDGELMIDPEVTDLIDSERNRKGTKPVEFTDAQIMNRILSAMQGEAHKVLEDGIAQRATDIDVVMVSGYGFPRWRGGPMHMASI